MYRQLQCDSEILMDVCYSVGRHDLIKPELSKLFFGYRIRHSKDLKSHTSIQTLGITQSQRDPANRKLQYQEVLDAVENKDEIFEAMKLISGWSDVEVLRKLIKERFEININQITLELSKDKTISVQGKFRRIERLATALYQIHYRRQDFKECYWLVLF